MSVYDILALIQREALGIFLVRKKFKNGYSQIHSSKSATRDIL